MSAFRNTLMVLTLSLMIVACATVSAPASNGDTLSFVHMNDTYRIGSVEGGNAGGFGRVVTAVRDIQSQGIDVTVLHGGDFLYPSLESQLWDGAQIVDAFNYVDSVAPMIVVAGNHEFDRRTGAQLSAAVNSSNFDWVGDNYRFTTGNSETDGALQSAFVYEADGRRVGVFGLTLHADHGGNDRDYVPTDADYIGTARAALEALQNKGVDVIVGLTHLHIWQDEEVAKLKAEYPKFLFIAGGHEHEPEYRAATAGSAAIVKGSSNARDIWRVDVRFDAGGEPRLADLQELVMDASVAIDEGYAAVEGKWRSQLLEKFPFLTATVGYAAVPLDGREVTVRNEESNWGNFIADQMRGAFGEHSDFAFLNSGTLRIDDVIVDEIRFEDIGRTFGFSSFLRKLELSGAEFKTILEAGFRGEGPSKGYFPQVSGFRVCVDRSRPDGERIVSLEVPVNDNWETIDAERMYSVVVPDFLYGGGDGYKFPKDRAVTPPGSELKYLVLDAIMAAQAVGEKVGREVGNDYRIGFAGSIQCQ